MTFADAANKETDMSDTLRVGMLGHGFMGAVHAHAWRTAHRFFDLPVDKMFTPEDKDLGA